MVRRGGGLLRRRKTPLWPHQEPELVFRWQYSPCPAGRQAFSIRENGSWLEGDLHLFLPRAIEEVRGYFERRSLGGAVSPPLCYSKHNAGLGHGQAVSRSPAPARSGPTAAQTPGGAIRASQRLMIPQSRRFSTVMLRET